MLICDKCDGVIKKENKFCPHCGDPVDEKDQEMQLDHSQKSEAEVVIQFGYSNSTNYQKAISICANLPSYEVTGEPDQVIHKVSLPLSELDLINNLYDIVSGWKSSSLLINGRISTKKDLTYSSVGCYKGRQEAHDKEQYCFGNPDYDVNFNIWGCKRLEMPFAQWAGWIDYGSFDENGRWFFDKEKIKRELEIKIQENKLCPALDPEVILETLNRFPDSIDPKQDSGWSYKSKREQNNGRWTNIATGLKPITAEGRKYLLKNIHEQDKQQAINDSNLNSNDPINWDLSEVDTTQYKKYELPKQSPKMGNENGVSFSSPERFIENEGERVLQLENPVQTKIFFWLTITLFPIVFSWLTLLNRECKTYEKIVAFVWMGVFISLFV